MLSRLVCRRNRGANGSKKAASSGSASGEALGTLFIFMLHSTTETNKVVLALALRWRRGTISAVQTQSLAGTTKARDLLRFLDDRPHSFEQVFLNALPSHWVKLPFREWRNISTRDEYLQRLERAKVAVEAKAAELAVTALEKELS